MTTAAILRSNSVMGPAFQSNGRFLGDAPGRRFLLPAGGHVTSPPHAGLGVDAVAASRFRPREPKALVASVLVHAALIGAFLVSLPDFTPERRKPPEMKTLNVSLMPGDGMEVAIPKASTPVEKTVEPEETPVEPPKPVPDPVSQDKPVEQPDDVTPQKQNTSTSQADAPAQPSSQGGGKMIWTPPAPTPDAPGITRSEQAPPEKRVELPKVELGKGASEPILMSYDQGRYSDAVAMSEAERLRNAGTITMSAIVDINGDVKTCVVTTSSGSKTLDERACLLIQSYKYRPAQDEKGKNYEAVVSEVLEWARDGKFLSTGPQSDVDPDGPSTPRATPRPQLPQRN